MTFTYPAVAFTPRAGAQPLYVSAAPAAEIVKWADAPHKQLGVKAGYQRELDEGRTENIKDFLNAAPENILPSAALIALREGSYTFADGVMTINPQERSSSELRAELLAEFKARLSSTEIASVEVAPDGGEQGDDVAEVDAAPPESYLAGLYQELLQYEEAAPNRREELDEMVATFTLPGLIIDGQHRIFGAKELPKQQVTVPIVFMPALSLSEQVFHFYVLNNKAKPLDKRQLRSIISTSLSKGEIDSLYERFRVSGLRADEAQWTYRVGSDTDSPFRGLVSLRLRGDEAPIDDNIMDQVVSRFMKLPRQYALLQKGVVWPNDDVDYQQRLLLFYAMWRAVRDAFPKAWAEAASGNKGSQLFQKVSLLQTQEYILRTLKLAVQFTKASPFASADAMYTATSTALERVPETFYLMEWKKKQLDTNAGKTYFLEQLELVAEAEGKNVGNFGLFKET